MSDTRFARLPKWARDEIHSLSLERDTLKKRLSVFTGENEGSGISLITTGFVNGRADFTPVPLPRHSTVQFALQNVAGFPGTIEVRNTVGEARQIKSDLAVPVLRISGGPRFPLIVFPVVTNVIDIGLSR